MALLENGYISNQEKQCTCKIILRRVHGTIFAVKIKKYYTLLCVCVRARARACVCVWKGGGWVGGCECTSSNMCLLTYPVCQAQTPYHLPPHWLKQIFRHYLVNGTIFRKVIEHKRVFWFSLQHLFETFLILRRIQRDVVTSVKTSSYKITAVFFQISTKLEFYRQKVSNTRFHRTPSSGSRVVSSAQIDRRTDGRTEDMTKIIVAFGNFAKAPKNWKKESRLCFDFRKRKFKPP
jgi:hypothetical protein